MRIAPPVLQALRDGAARGAAAAQDALRERFAMSATLSIAELGACSVADFPDSRWIGSGVEAVGLIGSHDESGAVAMLAMDPAVALSWLSEACPGADPAHAFPRVAEVLYQQLLTGLLEEEESAVSPRAFEDSKVAILLSTHAPPDTVILTCELALRTGGGGHLHPFQFHLLREPKRFRSA